MTPFHNANCPFGFIISMPGAIRVCNLPARERLDTHWPLRKVRPPGGLGTVHRIAYMRECELLAVAVSRQVRTTCRVLLWGVFKGWDALEWSAHIFFTIYCKGSLCLAGGERPV